MKNITLTIVFFLLLFPHALWAKQVQFAPSNVAIEMYLMRKGANVEIALFNKGSEVPTDVVIERKSTASLSNYRKIITLTAEHLAVLKTTGKLLLSDEYPESRQLDAFYRIAYITQEGVISNMPAIMLPRASDESITFGDHVKDASMFDKEEDLNLPQYADYNIDFSVKRVDVKVQMTIRARTNELKGYWIIERKSSKPLASYRMIKSLTPDDVAAVLTGERVFLDLYPESRKLDAYYRIVVVAENGTRIELPNIFLAGDLAN
jgi:hypothetical protein